MGRKHGGERDARSLASTGIGLRARLAADIRAEVVLAERLPAIGGSRSDSGPRILFSVQKQF